MQVCILIAWLSTLSWSLVSAQCAAPTTTVLLPVAATTHTVSAGTSASVTTSGVVARVESCGQARVVRGGLAIVDGGTVTVLGSTFGTLRYPATATIKSGTVATASSASITISPSGSGVVQTASLGVIVASLEATGQIGAVTGGNVVALNGYVDVKTAGPNVGVFAQSALATAYVTGGTEAIPIGSSRPRASAIFSGTAYLRGGPINAGCANGGTIYAAGASHSINMNQCQVTGQAPTGCFINGDIRATIEMLDGVSNTITLRFTGTATVGGPNTVTVGQGGTATLLPGVTAFFQPLAEGYLRSGVSNVIASNSALVNMDIGATITAEAGATLTSSGIATTITSAGEYVPPNGAATSTIWIAARAQTGNLVGRARPTGIACPPKKSSCPVLLGGFQCVDTFSDIYNCGGCALDGQGVDCTLSYDGQVDCVSGLCVERPDPELV